MIPDQLKVNKLKRSFKGQSRTIARNPQARTLHPSKARCLLRPITTITTTIDQSRNLLELP
jgi:hypothetical protein